MRIVIASDIHGRVLRTKKLAFWIDGLKPDKIILLGDLLYNGPRNGVPDDYDPLQVVSILNSFKDRVIGIRGNCDSRIDEELLGFSLANNRVLTLNGRRCDIYHGDAFTFAGLKPQKGDIVMSGHTHIPVLKEENGLIYLNPGSISFPKGDSIASFAIYDEDKITINSLEDGTKLAEMSLKR